MSNKCQQLNIFCLTNPSLPHKQDKEEGQIDYDWISSLMCVCLVLCICYEMDLKLLNHPNYKKLCQQSKPLGVINRPCVAGAVLQTPSS